MTELEQFLQVQFLGNSILRWGLALLALLLTFTVLPILRRYISALRKRRPASETHTVLDVVSLLAQKTTSVLLWSIVVWSAHLLLILPPRVDQAIKYVITVVVWVQIGIWIGTVAAYFIDRTRTTSRDPSHNASLTIVQFVARLAIWSIVLLVALDNLGVNITALVTGLGIGGIAVALAVQTVLGDLLASISIAFDKPFAVGDALTIGQDSGTVEQIGVSSTRLRSVGGEQLIISNADLLKSRVRNFGRMYERRVLFTIGVAYETPRDKLTRIPGIIEAAIRAQEKTRFERSHFTAFGSSALTFESVYFVLDPDYIRYANIQQAINFRIHEELGNLGVQFAYPTQRLLVEGLASAAPQTRPG
ncbi:MAG TPA: mechanosensitive ion channel family protein [Steroidobacteraceae bacterium]|nr:mechanosensitive ion channel family protein [Steroidobacteraceae bacterium]